MSFSQLFSGPNEKAPPACREHDSRAQIAQPVAALIQSHLTTVVVEHVGSTSAPGCAGKGIVDVMLVYPEDQWAAARDLCGVGKAIWLNLPKGEALLPLKTACPNCR